MNPWSCEASSQSSTSSSRRLINYRRYLMALAAAVLVAAPPAWAQTFDFGDAPDGIAPNQVYPTLDSNGGAQHQIDTSKPHLGATAPDSELDGQPNSNATGDGADEDGITFVTSLIAGEDATLEVVVTLGTNTSINTAYLDGWIDFDGNKGWTESNEHVIDTQALGAGTHSLTISIPSTSSAGTTFARFRLSTDAAGLASFNDDATDGEVEDYEVKILNVDWGDAPNSYDTIDVNNGPRHGITGPFMGAAAPDAESDGQLGGDAGADADGDDIDGNDDEDGVTFPTLIRGESAALTIQVGGVNGFVDAWIDFDANGAFEPGEKVAVHTAVTVGANTLGSFTVPNAAAVGNTYARVRISTNATTLPHTGLADDGEVEDYQVEILGLDFGDASDPSYPTLLVSDGGRHADTNSQPWLGANGPDVESDGQPTANADGDDNAGSNDEDGVVFITDLVPGQSASVEVTAAGVAQLDAWIDFNSDSDWLDTGEQIFTSLALVNGLNSLTFAVPADAAPGLTTVARFRYSTAGGLAPTGTAVDGEIEDLLVDIAPVADLGITKTVDVATAVPGRTRVTFTITATNNGPNDVVGATVIDTFGDDFVGIIWTCSVTGSAACGQSGGAGNIKTLIDLPDGDSATLTAKAWVVTDASGVTCGLDRCLSNTAQIGVPSGTYDLIPGNDSATDDTTAVLQPEADLSINKDDGLVLASPGDLGSYAIRVSNPGPSSATQVTVTDTFPVAKIEGHTTECGVSADPCWDCSPAPSLDELEVQIEGQDSVSGLEGGGSSVVSPDGAHVYATGSVDDAIVVFSRDAITGTLTWVEQQKDNVAGVDGLDGAAAVAISPDGKHVYAVGATDNAIAVFDRNGATGALTFVEFHTDGNGGVDGLAGAQDLVVSPDGANVYIAGPTDNSIAVFSRNSSTGALSFVEFHQDGAGATDGLAGASGLIVSPDGANLYITGPDDDAIAVFDRDADPNSVGFGTLTFREMHSDSPSSDGLNGANSVAISPDGAQVYVTGGTDNAIVVFSRNAGSGALTFVEFKKDNTGDINGLAGAAKVTVSPDGTLVFVAAPLNSAVAAFNRISDSQDPDFGKLTFADWFTSPGYGEAGAAAEVDGLGEAASVAMSPDGLFLFSTGKTVGKAASLVVMKVSAGGVCPDPATGTGDLSDQIAVPANSWVEFTAWYRIRNDATGTIHNEASMAIDLPTDLVDGSSTNNTDSDDTGVGLEVDIEITKVGGVAEPVPGEVLDYTITVGNHGPQNIDGSLGHITVSDLFPIYNGTTVMAGFDSLANITWTCTDGTGGLCIDTSGTGDISAQINLSAGGSVTLKAEGIVHPWSTGTIANTASFTLPVQYTDTNPANDQGQDSRALIPTADIGIAKAHQPPSDDYSVDPGDAFQYVIVVNNSGPSAVQSAQIQDVFPGELENTAWTCATTGGGSECADSAGTGNISTTVDLAPGGTAVFTVTTQVKVTAEGAVVNTVTVDNGNASDPNSANNIDDDVITLNAKADLAITKDDGRSEAVPGQSLTYTITVTNRGAQPYKDDVFRARVQDLFPPELLDVSWICDPTPPVPGTLTFLQLNTLIGRLDGAADVAVSPDGVHVYAVGANGHALVAYSRVMEQGANFGKLSSAPIDEEQRDVSDPDPAQWVLADLNRPTSVTISPDGRNVYVTAATGNAVVVFARDWASASDNFGTVTWVESLVDGTDGIDGLAGATDLVLSPDGEFLYIAGATDNAVAVFDRNTTTGRLTFIETLTDGIGGVDGLAGVRSLAISPQGDHIYAAGANDNAVSWFSRASDTGQLTFEQAYFNGAGGVDGLSGAASVILSPDGAQLYAAGPGDDALVTFQRNNDAESPSFGTLTFDVKLTSTEAEGLTGVRALALPYDLSNPQDRGEHVLAGGDPSGKLVIFRRNVTTGILSFQGVLREGQPITPAELTVQGLEIVSGIAFSPDGAHIYTTSDGDDALTVFDRRQPDPSFAFVEAETDGSDDGYGRVVSGLFAARSVTVTPDGDHVLATAFADDALVVFHRDPELGTTPDTRGKHLGFVAAYEDGGLDSVGQTIDGLDGAAQAVVSSDGNFVYVASEVDNAVAVFERNAGTGEMTFVEMEQDGVDDPDDGIGNPVDGLSGAVALAIGPTTVGGSYLYVAGQYEASVAVFSRESSNGSLSFVEQITNGVDGVEGLDGVSGIVVSPDLAHVYAVSRIDDAITVFERNQISGKLTFLQVIRDGVAAEGLDQAISVAISPDGAHLFVTAVNDDALSVFSRDNDETSDSFGRLSFVQVITDGSTLAGKFVDGLGGARTVAIDADGLRIFVGGEHDGALSVFGRVADETSPDFGALNLIETRYDGVDGVDGLNQVYGVAVSLSDNSHIYVAGLGDNAVAAFEARSGSSCTPSGLGDIDDEVNIGWGGQVAYTVEATIAPWATGTLTNEARVFAPLRTIDPDLIDDPIPQPGDNNYAVDQDVLTPKADLVLSKTDDSLSATAGEALTYTITVSNRGPSHAVGAEILDTDLDPGAPLSHFADAQWTCLATGSGSLNLAQILTDGDSQGSLTIDGLDGASALALSSDGLSLYATGLLEDSIVIFDRDLSTGTLTFVTAIFNGDDHAGTPVQGLGGASDVAIIDDGTVESLYVTGQIDDAVAVFTRNPLDGTLLFLHAVSDGIGAEGLDQAVAVVASDEGANVYVAGANDDAIAVFQRQPNGSLVFLEVVQQTGFGLDGVSDLAIAPDPDGTDPLLSYLYATGFNTGTVAVFSRAANGALTFVEKKGGGTSPYLGGAEAVVLDPNATFVYVAGSLDGSIVTFSRSASDGTLQLEHEVVQALNGLTGLAGITDLVVSPDGAHLYAAGQSADSVVLFSRDQIDGALTAIETFRDGAGQIDGLDGIAALALSPDGRQIYTAGMTDDAVAVFDRPLDSSCPQNGNGPIAEIVNIAAGGRLVFTADAIVKSNTPGSSCPEPLDPGRACVINEASVTTGPSVLFSDPDTTNNDDVDANYLGLRADLKITKTDQYAEYSGLLGATAVALDPALGRHLYLAGAEEGTIAIFDRNPGNGTLGYLGEVADDTDGVNGLGGVAGIGLSPNGTHLYAAGPTDNAVAVFERDSDTGFLNYLETEINGIAGTSALLGARAVAVSPDQGTHVYVAGTNSDAVAVFEREVDDASDHFGELTFMSFVQNGIDGAVNLTTPSDLVVTDHHLYVAASGANAVVVFERDTDPESADFGALTFLESHVDGVDDVFGLGGAVSIALEPSGQWLFVAGSESDGIAVFGRDLVTGELTFLDSVFQGDMQGDPGSEITVDGLAGVRAITVREIGPDVMVYTAGLADDRTTGAVARFLWKIADQALIFEEIVLDGDDLGGNAIDGLGGAAGLALADTFLYVAAADDGQLTAFEDAPGLTFVQSFTEGGGGIGPGETDPAKLVHYTITVTNLGPSQVDDAVVNDVFPPEFEDISWTCSVQLADGNDTHTSCETPSGSGDLEETVDIAVGGAVIFTATGRVRPEMTGTLSNTATVDVPEGLIDPDLGNNSDTDDDTLLTPMADLMIDKIRVGAPVPGEDLTYVITVTNNGPSFALGNTVSDALPEALVNSIWSCEAMPPPGLLEPTVGRGYNSLGGASGLAITSDKTFLYAVGWNTSELLVFSRDSRTGALTLTQTLTDGIDGVDGLGGALAVALSPDDKNVYVAGEIDDAIAVFSRDATSGELTMLEVHRDGIGIVNGLGGVQSLDISSDGRSLYAAGAADSAVAVFERNATNGSLTYVEILQQGVDGVDGLAGVADVAISHDGAHLYAVGPLGNAVAVFERHPSTGELLFLEVVANGDVHELGTVEGLGGAAGVAISHDDANLYIVGELDNALAVFSRNSTTGELAFVEVQISGSDGVSGIDGPLAVTLSDDDNQVYVAGAGSNSVAAFARAATDGALHFLNSFDSAGGFSGLGGVRDLVPCGGGKHLYAAGRLDGEVVLLARMIGSTCASNGLGDIDDTVSLIPGGTATYTLTGRLIPGATGELINTARVTPGPTVVDPDDANNQSTTIDNQIEPQADLAITKDDGLLEVNAGDALTYQIQVVNNGPSDVYGVTVTDFFPLFPTENAGLSDGSIDWTCVATNSLIAIETHIDTVDGIDGLEGTSWVVANPDPDGPGGETGGDHLYVTGTAAGAISTFAFNSGTGAFEQVQVLHDDDEIDGVTLNGLAGASGLAFSPDGLHLYVTATVDNSVAVFERDVDPNSPDYGNLVFVDAQVNGTPFQGLVGAIDVTVSPNGLHVYVVSKESNSVLVYLRDSVTGMLTYIERKIEGSDDVPLASLDGARDIVMTPDGVHLYIASQDADAVTVFRRDPASGRLTFVDVVRNLDMQGSVTVNGLDFVRSLVLSPGGHYLYAVSLADDAIVVFERDGDADSSDFGHLTFLEVYRDGLDLIDGLDGATAVTISPDGSYLYVAGFNDDSVAVFRRDWTTGSLTQVELVQDQTPGIDSLDGVSGLALTPDGAKLLSTAANDNALTVFERTAEGACNPSGVPGLLGELQETIDLTAGATATFVVQATVDTGARGTLVNQAEVVSPLLDPDPLNNLGTDDDTVITVFTDLGVTKDDGLETAIAGLPLTYSIVVSNAGPALAYGITVTDALPPMLLGCTCTRSDALPCAIDGTNTLVDVIDLDAASSLTYTIDCLLDPATAEPVTNTVTVTPEDLGHDINGSNDQATDSDSVVAVSDLVISKGNGLDEVIPGTPVTYAIEIANLGPSRLSLGRVTDQFPAQMEGTSWTCVPSAGAACTPGPVAADLIDDFTLPAGGSVIYTASGLVNPAVLGTIANTAVAEVLIDDGTPGVSATDPDLSNNVATDIDSLTPFADLNITKTDDVDPVVTGYPLNYTITVSNPTGPSWAHDVVITDILPAGVTLVGTTGCTEDPGGIPNCSIGQVANGDTAQVMVAVTIDEGTLGIITNQAGVSSSSEDQNPADNTTTEDTVVDPWANLSIEKTDGEDPVVAGTELTYTITVTNPGPYDADDVVVTDSMPTGVTFVSSSGCAEDPSALPTCSLGSIIAGGSAAYHLTVAVDSYTLGTITNDAVVVSAWFDPDTADNDTFEDTEITAESDLLVTKDNGLPFLVPGWDITYTIVVVNDGPSDAPSADVTDEIPAELLAVDWTCVPTGSAFCSDGTGNLLLDSIDLPAGEMVTYSVTCTVDPAIDLTNPVTITNTVDVVVTGSGVDPNTANNSATDADPVEETDVLWEDGFETGDTTMWSETAGGTTAAPARTLAVFKNRVELPDAGRN